MVTTITTQAQWLTLISGVFADDFPQVITQCRNLIAGAGGLESFAVQEWLRMTIKTDTPRLDLLSSVAFPALICRCDLRIKSFDQISLTLSLETLRSDAAKDSLFLYAAPDVPVLSCEMPCESDGNF